MGAIIEIKDTDSRGSLSVELKHILELLTPVGHQLSWAILDLYATGDLGEGKNILDLEQKIQQSPEGLSTSWDELVSLSLGFFEIIDTVIVGYKDPNYRPKLSPNHRIEELYRSCEIVIELIDASLWSIYARDDEMIQRFQLAFHDVMILKPPFKGEKGRAKD